MPHSIFSIYSLNLHLSTVRTLLMVALAFFIYFTNAEQTSAANYLVTTNADNTDGTSSTCNPGSNGLCTLRQAINAANYAAGDDSIYFAPSMAGQTITVNPQIGAILINTNMTIDAANAYNVQVSGGNAVGVFSVYGNATVTMRNFTIRNALGGNGGGGIGVNSSILTLDEMVISNNSASLGGGIYISRVMGASSLTVTNSTISGNSGGGIFSTVPVTLTNVFLTNNYLNTPDLGVAGGGMYAVGDATLINCTVAGNTVSSSGTGFNRGGGGVYFKGGTNYVSGTTFSGNSAATGDGNGGGFAVGNSSALTIVNSTVSGNTAYNGGGLYSEYNATTTLRNVTIARNTATNAGGGIFHPAPPEENLTDKLLKSFRLETLELANTIVADNAAPINSDVDGAINSLGNNLVRRRGASTGYIASDLPDNTNPRLAPLGQYGGSILTYALSNNSPAINAGNNTGASAIDQRGVARQGSADIGSFEVNNDYVAALPNGKTGQSYNFTIAPDAGIFTYALAPGSNPLPPGLTVNTDMASQMAVLVTGTPTMAGTYNFTVRASNADGSASDTNYQMIVAQGQTAGVFTVNTNADNESDGCSVGNCTLREAITEANTNGIADTINFDSTFFNTTRTIILTEGQFSIDADGGNLLTINGAGAERLKLNGGGQTRIFYIVEGANANVNNLTVINGSASSGGYGGGIFNVGALTLTNAAVSNCIAPAVGGGIYNQGVLIVQNSVVSGNTVRNYNNFNSGRSFGGGIASYGSAATTITIKNSTISGNTATTTVTGANGVGGGLYIQDAANVSNSTFSGNTAAGTSSFNGNGGGIANNGAFTLTNSTLSGNTAGNAGGGMQSGTLAGAAATLTNVTVTGNNNPNGFGGGVRNFGTIKMRNTIVAGNMGPTDPDVSNGANPAFVSLGNNLIGNVGTASGFTNGANGDLVGANNAPVFARLAPLGNYGGATFTHALLDGGATPSPAINAGSNCVIDSSCTSDNAPSALTTDQRGAARQGVVDIGSFEFNGAYIASLPNGAVNQSYNQVLVHNNSGFTYTLTSGSLPPSLTLSTAFAPEAVVAIGGMPTKAGIYDFAITAANGTNSVTTKYRIVIDAGTSTASIAGTLTYGTSTETQSPKLVSNVLMAVSGDSSVSANTNSAGAYLLGNLITGGQYTVTPSKGGNVNGITPFDATLVLRCVAAGTANCTLTNNQKLAADTNNSNSITPFDATQILRYVAANAQTSATGQVGNWKFVPSSRNYSPLSNSLTNENYEAILIGEVNGSWMP